jgi:hypothetical protein
MEILSLQRTEAVNAAAGRNNDKNNLEQNRDPVK